MCVLIVEDDEVNAKILDLNLRKHGYRTVSTRTGKQALDYLTTASDVQLVIADICMPEMTGLELLNKMRENSTLSKIPVIMCTSKSDSETVRQAIGLGCRDYIVKPVNACQLLQKVQSILPLEEEPAKVVETGFLSSPQTRSRKGEK